MPNAPYPSAIRICICAIAHVVAAGSIVGAGDTKSELNVGRRWTEEFYLISDQYCISEFVVTVHIGSVVIWGSNSHFVVEIEVRSSVMGSIMEAMSESVASSLHSSKGGKQ